MRRLIKYLFRLAVLLMIAFAGYAIFGELPAPVSETVVTLPVPKGAQ